MLHIDKIPKAVFQYHMHERVYRQWCTDVSEAFILLYQILNWKKPQKKKIKQTNLHFLFESHDPHHMRTLHKNSGGRGFPSGHARDGCLRTGTKLLIPDFPGSHVPLNASFHAYTEHNKVFFFTAYSLLALFFLNLRLYLHKNNLLLWHTVYSEWFTVALANKVTDQCLQCLL